MHTACTNNIIILGTLLFYRGGAVLTIELLDDRRLLIALAAEDMQTYGLSFEKLFWKDNKSRDAIKDLLEFAEQKTGFSVKGKRLKIETIPQSKGCVMLFTLITNEDVEKRKIFKIKGTGEPFVYEFENAEDLLCAIERIFNKTKSIKDSRLLGYNRKYYLSIYTDTGLSPHASVLLSEYGRLKGNGHRLVSRIGECGTIIVPKNAIQVIGKYF